MKLRFIFLFSVFCFLFSLSFAEKKFVYDSKGKRDPFIPLVTSEGNIVEIEPEEEIPGINLEGIIYDPNGESYAIVNKMVVKTQDTIGDYKVFKIESERILLLKDKEIIELRLKKEISY